MTFLSTIHEAHYLSSEAEERRHGDVVTFCRIALQRFKRLQFQDGHFWGEAQENG